MSPPEADPAPPVRLHFVQAAGVRLHAASAGEGDPLLLLHGFPDHWRVWEPLMQPLAQHHHVLAPDLRGINLSDKPEGMGAYHVDRLVEDLQALILGLGGRCTLIGHDWGGMLAWAVAARHPELVKRLIVLNAPHPCLFAQQLRKDPAQREASRYIQRLCAPGAAEALARDGFSSLWAARGSEGLLPDVDAHRQQWLRAWTQPGAMEAALNWYRAIDIEEALSEIGVQALPGLAGASGHIEAPTLVIWGERDGSFPLGCLEGLECWVPCLQLHRVPEGGHWLLLEQPNRVARLVMDFLEDEP